MRCIPLSALVVPKRRLPFLLAVMLFVVQFGISLSDVPSKKLIQDIICKHHYNLLKDEVPPDIKCGIGPVQQEVKTISTGIFVSTAIGSALVSLPFGVVADRVGRLPVLALSLLSVCLCQLYTMFICWQWKNIPLEAIWGVGGVAMFGGGRVVEEAMVFAIISDVVAVEKRSRWFQWVTASALSADILAPIIAKHLVQSSVWMTLFLSLGLTLVGGTSLIALAPESLPVRDPIDSFNERTAGTRKSIVEILKSLFCGPALWFLPGVVLPIPLVTIQSELLQQFMPVKFSWSLGDSELLLLMRKLISLTSLAIFLPGCVTLWRRYVSSKLHHADYAIAFTCSFLAIAGALCLTMTFSAPALLAGLTVSALGSGLPTLSRAMLLTWMEGHRVSSVLGILAAGQVMGFVAFELGIGALFRVGLKLWMGLPFCLGAVFALVVEMTTCLAPEPWVVFADEDEDED